jgi:hypothetical protein
MLAYTNVELVFVATSHLDYESMFPLLKTVIVLIIKLLFSLTLLEMLYTVDTNEALVTESRRQCKRYIMCRTAEGTACEAERWQCHR